MILEQASRTEKDSLHTERDTQTQTCRHTPTPPHTHCRNKRQASVPIVLRKAESLLLLFQCRVKAPDAKLLVLPCVPGWLRSPPWATYPYSVNLNLYLQSLSYGCFRQVPPPSQILWVWACPGRGTREPIGTIQLACYWPWLFTDSIWSSAPPPPAALRVRCQWPGVWTPADLRTGMLTQPFCFAQPAGCGHLPGLAHPLLSWCDQGRW